MVLLKLKNNLTVYFTQKVADIEPVTLLNIQGVVYSSKETPRLKTQQGEYLTANKKFVKEISF